MKRSSHKAGKHAAAQRRRHVKAHVLRPNAPALMLMPALALLPALALVPVITVGMANALPAADSTPAKPAVRSFSISDADNAAILVSRAESRSILSDGEWETAIQVDADDLTREVPKPEPEPESKSESKSKSKSQDEQSDVQEHDSSIAYSVSEDPPVSDVPGNAYPWSNCTWWVFIRRTQLGLPVANHWGNAEQWADSARAAGLVVDRTPSVGAIMVFARGQEGSSDVYGHVAVVEQVNPDGSVVTSEMGIKYQGHTFSRIFANTSDFEYIH